MTDSKNKERELITTKQFAWASLMITTGFAFWLIPVEGMLEASNLFFVVATFVLMSRKERSEPVPVSHFIGILIGLALLITFCIVGKHWFPDEWAVSVEHFMRSPFVVLPLWALTELSIFRRWRFTPTQPMGGNIADSSTDMTSQR